MGLERNIGLMFRRYICALEVLCCRGSEDTLAAVAASFEKEERTDENCNEEDEEAVDPEMVMV